MTHNFWNTTVDFYYNLLIIHRAIITRIIAKTNNQKINGTYSMTPDKDIFSPSAFTCNFNETQHFYSLFTQFNIELITQALLSQNWYLRR